MNKPALWPTVCALLLGALVATWWTPTTPALAQGRRYKVVEWEYRVFPMDPQDYKDKADYRQILAREGPRKVEAAFEEHVLKYLGKKGWELVTRERLTRTNVVYFYLKRRVP